MNDQEPIDRQGYEALWGWFGLSRASWLTIPRVLMHEMPDQWQADMARLLYEYNDRFPNATPGRTIVSAKSGNKIVAMPEAIANYRRPDREFIDQCSRPAW